MKKWRENNRQYVKNYRKEHYLKNQELINQHKKLYRQFNPEKIKAYRQRVEVKEKARLHMRERRLVSHDKDREYYRKNRVRILEYGKHHNQIPEVKARRNELARINRRANPHSNRSADPELQLAMNSVRIRDKNTCQWYGCGLTHRNTSIHVHHIFPRSEYPDLELIEQYMICYCANHHSLWHRYRGDKYSEMILQVEGTNTLINYITGEEIES